MWDIHYEFCRTKIIWRRLMRSELFMGEGVKVKVFLHVMLYSSVVGTVISEEPAASFFRVSWRYRFL
jgi:hypothetical protein